MAQITAGKRKRLPDSAFGLQKQRKYPLDTVRRAINAKARAKQQLDRGRLTRSQYNMIVKRANRVIAAGKGLG